MNLKKISQYLCWFGLGGYAFSGAISIALSQIMFGIALLGFLIKLSYSRERFSDHPFSSYLFLVVIACYSSLKLISILVHQSDLLIIKEEWMFLMIVIGMVRFRDIKKLNIVIDLLAAGVILIGGYGIWQHFVGIDLYHEVMLDRMIFGYRAIGNFSTYLTFSGFFAIASIFLVSIAWHVNGVARKVVYLIASQIGLFCVLFNYSRSTILAIILGIILLVILINSNYRKWASLVILVSLAVGLLISPDFMSRFKQMKTSEISGSGANSRIAIWKTSFRMVAEEPLLGIGPGNYHNEYRRLRDNRTGKNLSHAHNDIINTAAETGLLSAAAFLLFWLIIVLKLYRGFRRCPEGYQKGLLLGVLLASIVFLAMAQFEAFFADEEVRLLLMFFWGIGLAVLANLKATEKLSEIA